LNEMQPTHDVISVLLTCGLLTSMIYKLNKKPHIIILRKKHCKCMVVTGNYVSIYTAKLYTAKNSDSLQKAKLFLRRKAATAFSVT